MHPFVPENPTRVTMDTQHGFTLTFIDTPQNVLRGKEVVNLL